MNNATEISWMEYQLILLISTVKGIVFGIALCRFGIVGAIVIEMILEIGFTIVVFLEGYYNCKRKNAENNE